MLLKLAAVTFSESITRPDLNVQSYYFTADGDETNGKFDLSLDTETGLVKVGKRGKSKWVHVTRVREMRLDETPAVALPAAPSPTSPETPLAKHNKAKRVS